MRTITTQTNPDCDCDNPSQCWEPCGQLGHDEEFVRVSEFSDINIEALINEDFQEHVHLWLLQCFDAEITGDKIERNHRFLEEALELVQAGGCTKNEAYKLVDYVFSRDVGEKKQEVGGVMVTLAAWCVANGISMKDCGDVELKRIWGKIDQIREKQKSKPALSPLPGVYPDRKPAIQKTKRYACVVENITDDEEGRRVDLLFDGVNPLVTENLEVVISHMDRISKIYPSVTYTIFEEMV